MCTRFVCQRIKRVQREFVWVQVRWWTRRWTCVLDADSNNLAALSSIERLFVAVLYSFWCSFWCSGVLFGILSSRSSLYDCIRRLLVCLLALSLSLSCSSLLAAASGSRQFADRRLECECALPSDMHTQNELSVGSFASGSVRVQLHLCDRARRKTWSKVQQTPPDRGAVQAKWFLRQALLGTRASWTRAILKASTCTRWLELNVGTVRDDVWDTHCVDQKPVSEACIRRCIRSCFKGLH